MTFITSTPAPSPIPSPAFPVFNYTSRDYNSIYGDMLDRIPIYLSEWTSRSTQDFGIVLLQMFAFMGDLLNYYVDRLSNEAFMQTATQPSSILNIAAMLGYTPTLSTGATVELEVTVAPTVTFPYTIPAGTEFQTLGSSTQAPIVFTTTEAVTIPGDVAATPTVVANINATQGNQYTNEVLGASSGALNQVFGLANSPVSADSFVQTGTSTVAGAPTLAPTQVSVDLGLGPQVWTYVQNLVDVGPTAQVYTTFVDSNSNFYIVFGDGVNGLVPPLGSPVYCTYMTNDGAIGNVGAGTITQPVSALIGVTVTNLLAASGGSDAESLTSIQQNAPASLRTSNRAVTLEDWATLGEQIAGIQWAASEQVTYQLVNLYIAPFGGGSPSASLIQTVLSFLSTVSMANTTITVLAPTYVPINVSVNVQAYANYANASVQSAVAAALTAILALSNTGFGYRVSLGLIYQIILAIPGVNWAIVTGLYRQMLCTLTTALISGDAYLTLGVSPLPQAISSGDTIVLTNSNGTTQSLIASQSAQPGAVLINVDFFLANAAYSIGSTVEDPIGTNDSILLMNEIPVPGVFNVAVAGGVA